MNARYIYTVAGAGQALWLDNIYEWVTSQDNTVLSVDRNRSEQLLDLALPPFAYALQVWLLPAARAAIAGCNVQCSSC